MMNDNEKTMIVAGILFAAVAFYSLIGQLNVSLFNFCVDHTGNIEYCRQSAINAWH